MSFKVRYLGFVKGDGQSVFCESPVEKAGGLNGDGSYCTKNFCTHCC